MQNFLRILCWGVCGLIGLRAAAQQKPQYSQYLLNQYLLNPAVGGIEDFVDVKAGYRNQWTTFEGAPTTFYLTGHLALGKAERTSALPVRNRYGRSLGRTPVFAGQQKGPAHHGVGMVLVADQTGPTSRTTLNLSYAYHYPLTNRLRLSAGVSGGVTQHTTDFDQLRLLNPVDLYAQQGKVNALQPDLNAGLFLYDDRFFAGLGTQQLAFKRLNYRLVGGTDYQPLGRLYTHYFLTAGYRHALSADWAVVPSVLLKSVRPAPVSFDVNAKFLYQERFWMGLSYRHRDAVVGLIGMNVNSLVTLGYSYDYVLSDLRTAARGSHEIVLGLMINNRQRVICPRLF
jgi:type IX secretion system PorP/SprF family membrane protein